MFEFNKYDCFGNEYVCLSEGGTFAVYLNGESAHIGNYASCVRYVDYNVEAEAGERF